MHSRTVEMDVKDTDRRERGVEKCERTERERAEQEELWHLNYTEGNRHVCPLSAKAHTSTNGGSGARWGGQCV